jgi:hypothetical protein
VEDVGLTRKGEYGPQLTAHMFAVKPPKAKGKKADIIRKTPRNSLVLYDRLIATYSGLSTYLGLIFLMEIRTKEMGRRNSLRWQDLPI